MSGDIGGGTEDFRNSDGLILKSRYNVIYMDRLENEMMSLENGENEIEAGRVR